MACVSSVCTSLTFLNASRATRTTLSLKPVAATGLLHSSFVSSSSLSLSSSSASSFS
ncbi:hypothetical protein Tco_0226607, partial [Tanacetum coccineum]